MTRLCTLVIFALSITCTDDAVPARSRRAGEPLAFPEAEGAGTDAIGGRGGSVFIVTSLAERGPGTLSDAVSQANRFIVFAVSGIIDLNGRELEVTQPNITIAGQTAPGEGICLRGASLTVKSSNVVVRHLRLRRGFVRDGDMDDGFSVKADDAAENVLADHLSASWATDENLTLTVTDRTTAQWCIASEALNYFNPQQTPNRHAFGSLWGSRASDGRVTMHHNLWAHHLRRSPRMTGGGDTPPVHDFRNNVVYDGAEYTSHTGNDSVRMNWVGNWYKDGPSTWPGTRGVLMSLENAAPKRLFLSGNVLEGRDDLTADNWLAVRAETGASLPGSRSSVEFAAPPVRLTTALAARDAVFDDVGATLPARDAVDLRIVDEVRNGTGRLIEREADLQAWQRWPAYRSLPAPTDDDHDGMADAWERSVGANPSGASDAMGDLDRDGSPNIEEYVNNTAADGSALPVVWIAATDSRAGGPDGGGAWRVWRRGDLSAPLTVRYSLSGTARANSDYEPLTDSVTIASGARFADLEVVARTPGDVSEARVLVATLVGDASVRVGCPSASLVVLFERR